MDNLTHAALGASISYAATHRSLGRRSILIGAWGATLPDLDVLIPGGANDPLFKLEMHRHFTHSFAFAPLGALLATLPFLLFPRWRKPFGVVYLASLLGYLSHIPLDGLTAYGTPMWLPFLRDRIAWDSIAIVDIFLTLPFVAMIATAFVKRSAKLNAIALLFACSYFALGSLQRARAIATQEQLAEVRGHERVRGRVLPMIGSLLVWRSVYEAHEAGRKAFHADAIRVGLFSQPLVKPGTSAPKLESPPEWPKEFSDSDRAAAARDLERFRFFADDYLVAPEDGTPGAGDFRYSAAPESKATMWGVSFSPAPQDGSAGVTRFERRLPQGRVQHALAQLWRAWTGADPDYQPLSSDLRRAE